MITTAYLEMTAQDIHDRTDKVMLNGVEVVIESMELDGTNLLITTEQIEDLEEITLIELVAADSTVIISKAASLELSEDEHVSIVIEANVRGV